MAYVTLRVLHGADRGKVYEHLPTPVTIGREEGNTIRLNDERISRYHLKLQEDNDKVVVTDLESTNGTKVNGEDIQVRILRDGDMIAVGRSLLLVGSHTDIDRRIAEVAARLPASDQARAHDMGKRLRQIAAARPDVAADLSGIRPPILPGGLPPPPGRMSPAQSAEFVELFDHVQAVLREASEGGVMRPGAETVEIDFGHWQALLDLQAQLAEMLRKIGDPHQF
jgi:hypothetical protein